MPFPTVIDNSMREAWRKCQHFFFRKYVEGWDSKRPSVHLHAGAAYAHGLEVMRREFYDHNASPDDALLAGAAALITSYGDFETDTQKTLWNMVSALVFYADERPLATDYVRPHKSGGVSSLEFTFAIPLPINHPETGEPLLYAGRFDMLAEYQDMLVIYDDKTASQLGRQWASRWELASQMTGYVWAAQQFGYQTSTFIVRGVSITSAGNHSMEEYIGHRPQWMIDRWYNQLLHEIYDMIAAYWSGRWDFDLSSSCSSYGGCEFIRVCTARDPDPWLASDFTHRSYDPLNVGD